MYLVLIWRENFFVGMVSGNFSVFRFGSRGRASEREESDEGYFDRWASLEPPSTTESRYSSSVKTTHRCIRRLENG